MTRHLNALAANGVVRCFAEGPEPVWAQRPPAETLDTLIAMLNAGVQPIIPSQGSLGASGDLAPLAHLALVLSRDPDDDDLYCGEAIYQGERLSGSEAMQRAGLRRRVLGAKEALALNNGATFSAALAALAVCDAEHLLDKSIVALAMSLEALRGVSRAYDAHLHAARKQVGQIAVAAQVRDLIAGSTLIDATDRGAGCLLTARRAAGVGRGEG